MRNVYLVCYLFLRFVPAADEEDQVVLLVGLQHDVGDGLRRDRDAHFEEVERPRVVLRVKKA